MNERWHEQIQRYVAGDSTHEETTALQQALMADAELRALYLDYLNLDLALGAAAEAATCAAHETGRMATYPQPSARAISHLWPWLAATAACAALIMLAVLPRHRDSSPARYDLDATISSTQAAVAQLAIKPASSFPAWMSPTASMLERPVTPE